MNPFERLNDDDLGREVTAALALPEVPEALVQRALGLWPARTASMARTARAAEVARAEPSWSDLFAAARRHVQAVLGFDSWAAAPLASATAMRSAGSAPRHLVFRAGELDVGLRLVPEGEAYTVSGQLLGTGATPETSTAPATLEWRALGGGGPRAGADSAAGQVFTCDELGGFHLEGVEPGRYELRLRLGEEAIALPPIDVGERPG